MIWSHNCE